MGNVESQRVAFGSFHDVVPVVDRLMAETTPPRAPEDLLDLVTRLDIGPGSLVLDAGSYAGVWSRRLGQRFGCRVVAVDVVYAPVLEAHHDGTPAMAGDVQQLPVKSSSVDLVWCRDMLSCGARVAQRRVASSPRHRTAAGRNRLDEPGVARQHSRMDRQQAGWHPDVR